MTCATFDSRHSDDEKADDEILVLFSRSWRGKYLRRLFMLDYHINNYTEN